MFRFYHLYAPHSPYQLDEKFNFIGTKPLTRKWFKAQTEGALWVLSEMIQVLKDIDVFDDALIILSKSFIGFCVGYPKSSDP